MARLQAFFPKIHGKPPVDDRRMLSGIFFVNRNGLRWCDARRDYGPHKALCNRWRRRATSIFVRLMEGWCQRGRAKDRHDRRDLPEGTLHGI
jgi:transposase